MGYGDIIARKITPKIAEQVSAKLSEVVKQRMKQTEEKLTARMEEWDKRMRETIKEIVLDELGPMIDKKIEERLRGQGK